MIAELRLRRFKRFDSLDLELAPLTVLTGLNSAGKSTTLQALLLLRAGLRCSGQAVGLNSDHGLALGEPLDVLHRGSANESIELSVRSRDRDEWTGVSLGIPSDPRALYLAQLESSAREHCPLAIAADEPRFTYLCAERHGPRDTQSAESSDASHLGVGIYGQRSAQVLSLKERDEVSQGRWAPAAEVDRIAALRFLGRQTERWLARILGLDVVMRIEARWLDGTSVTTLRFQPANAPAEWTRPQNVGFGVSYTLPIIVAALQMPAGGLLIIENPEAHLHPAGQSAIGAFLAQVAGDGVQVIIETHSDHVINGIRRAVAEKAVTLPPEDVAVLFFCAGPDARPTVQRIALRETGELSTWPQGFFDQMEHDLGAIARARRGARKR